MQDNTRETNVTSSVTLASIAKPINNDLRAFRRFFREELRSDNVLLDTALRYILRRKGKQIRPILVLLSASAAGSVSERSYVGATLVELLHTATLVHDDVVDEASERRGLPSLNSLWNNKLAVLVGDYLLAHGLRISNAHGEFRFLDITSRAVQRMSKGELLQTRKTRKLDIDEAEYYRIISDKTASLISACCEIGAVSASESSEVQNGLREYGEELGLAFQIRDDLFDYTGAGNATGKPIGNDLQEKKLTLPLIHALQKSPRAEARRILKLVRRGGASESAPFEEIIEFVRSNGGVDYAVSAAEGHRDRAKSALESLPDSPGRTSLAALADFVVDRAM